MSTNPKWIALPRFDGSIEEANFIMAQWAAVAFTEWTKQKVCLRSKDARIVNEAIAAIQEAAHTSTGFSSLALEMLRRENTEIKLNEKASCVVAIIDCASVMMDYDLESVEEKVAEVAKVWRTKISWCLWWVHAKPDTYDFYTWRNVLPLIHVENRGLRPDRKIEPEAMVGGVVAEEDDMIGIAERAEKYLKRTTKGQRPALRALIQLAEVRARNFASPIDLKWSPLLVGPSGAGKTYLCNLFAKIVALPPFEATVGSWHIKGGSNPAEATTVKIMAALDATPIVLLLDEVEKVKSNGVNGGGGDVNSSYFASVFDEILAVMDGRLDSFGGTAQARRNLKKSWIIAAGAFQHLYNRKLGGRPPLVVEEIELMEPLTYAEILEHGSLPTELLNRISSDFLEVKTPDLAEHLHMMTAIEKKFGVEMEPEKREEEARNTILSMQGMRGLQRHALNAAKAALAMEKDEAKRKGV